MVKASFYRSTLRRQSLNSAFCVKRAELGKRAFLTSMLTALYRANQQALAPMARDSYDPYARYTPRTSGRTNPAIDAYQRTVQTTNGMTRPGAFGTAVGNARRAQLAQAGAWVR